MLYPHFVPWVTPGWLDKYLPWRARPRGHDWLSNVVLIAPSRAMLERLPNGKLPDRNDFYRYENDQRSAHRGVGTSDRRSTTVRRRGHALAAVAGSGRGAAALNRPVARDGSEIVFERVRRDRLQHHDQRMTQVAYDAVTASTDLRVPVAQPETMPAAVALDHAQSQPARTVVDGPGFVARIDLGGEAGTLTRSVNDEEARGA